ncbi:pyridoxamine 5'-phosphate oxidase [Prolixibacteraceae bacterium JC049]|nr:pyridoxamine 5'-phosphate oxidase [Prolixibacteraceae bacterium JC049]
MNRDLSEIRRTYNWGELSEEEMKKTPMEQFDNWYHEVLKSDSLEPTAMMLATVGSDGMPHCRVVLLKKYNEKGFVFYTNYNSRKARDLEANPKVGITFYWPEMERQVRVEGRVERVSEKESDDYFASRPIDSQLGAWASPQSQTVNSRDELEDGYEEIKARFESEELKRPEFWGGYRVVPCRVEFWQGRPNRLHDRLVYQQFNENHWRINRLAP